MSNWYYIVVTIHVFAAIIWLGGLFFIALVGAPVLRKINPPSLRSALFTEMGERFRTVGWIALGILVITGASSLHFRGLLSSDVWSRPLFWASPYGHALTVKLAAVIAILIGSAFHDFVLGPRASLADPESEDGKRLRTLASWIARFNALLGVVLITAAVRLARGG